ncbi:DNRLRE domain-containing protein [Streptomyces sp. NPDC002308]
MRRTALAITAVLAVEATLVAPGVALAAPTGAPEAVASVDTKTGTAASTAESVAAALLMARLQNRKIEALSERTETSTTWALPSGELQTAVYAAPIRTKTGDTWETIDTSLADTGASLEPRTAMADIEVSDGGDAALAKVSKGRKSFGLGWESTLPAPKIADDTASYDLGAGETLTVTALPQGFSQNVVLDKAPKGKLEYRIPVTLKGLRMSEADSGHLLLKDADGTLVAEAPAPMMWDSSKDRASGESSFQERVPTEIETAPDGTQTLVLTPDADYFAQDLTYPVTVDPTSTLAATTDTWVATNYPDSQISSEELKTGTYDAGTTKARSYLKFDVAAFKGKHITDTNLALYSFYSSTCSTAGAGTQVRRITSAWESSDVTWAAQPSTTTTGAVTSTEAKGYNTSCPPGTMNFDIDAIVQAWAAGSANYGIRVAGADESDSLTWRRFHSANHVSGNGSTEPHLTVTYNSYPAVPASAAISPSQVNAYNGTRYVTSLTPTLSAKVTDPDGAKTKAQFEVTADPASADTTYSYTGTSAEVASGSTAKLTIPAANAFPSGSHLRYRVRAYDGADYGAWSGYSTFALNTAKPVAPTVTCDAYPENGWTARAAGPVDCTIDTTSTDGAGYHWGLDDASLSNTKLDTTNGTGGDSQTVSIAPDNGWHTLYARTMDSGGNLSTAVTAYNFGVGTDGAAVLSPQEGAGTARRLTLAAKGKPTYTGVTWQYRRGEADAWHTVPAADVTSADGTAVAWPVKVTGGTAAKLVWNVVSSLAEDGAIELRAAFTDGTTSGYSQTVETVLDRDAGNAPATDLGPGSLNQLTGDYTLSGTDASAFLATVGRTFSSRSNDTDTEGQAPIFGPGWVSSVSAEGTDYTQLRTTSPTSVELLSADGTAVAFTATSGGGWKPQTGAESLTLSGTLGGTKFTLTDTDANVAVFTKSTASAPTWTLSSAASAADDSTVTVASEAVTTGGRTLSRPKYVISPGGAATAATCQSAPSTKGCRVLEFVYASATTATASSLGDFADQVKALTVWATDPGADKATAETVAAYAYDASGRLREAWDPRISPALKTAYTYDADGRVTTFSQPGELPWTFGYGKAGAASTAGAGMLLQASRPALQTGSNTTTSGTAVASVVYDVPLSGAKAPYQMDKNTVATWAQDVEPVDATAVFPPDAVPSSHTGGSLGAGDYQRAVITYIDADGGETNTAGPGGAITTTEYDEHGNTAALLTAANRELALGTSTGAGDVLDSLGLRDLTTAQRAEQLATLSEYSADGQRLTDEYGPLHAVTLAAELKGSTSGTTLPAGTVVLAREHTSHSYDENRPGTAKVSDLVTSTRIGAAIAGYATDADTSTTTTSYDWATGQERAVEGGDPTSTVATYDSAGRTATTRSAGSSGSDAAALVHTYYTADGSGTCAARPEWAGRLCRTAPAADISGGGTNPKEAVTTVYTYDRWGNPATIAETANGVTRTTTRVSDSAGRVVRGTVSGGLGEAVGPSTVTYDRTTGRIATQTANGRTIAYTYDALGRPTSYDDGSGNTVTTAYDLLDRAVSTTDSAPSTVAYAYDTADRLTTVTDSVAGTYTATYDADGTTTGETLPGGYKLTLATDPTGDTVSREYADVDGNTVLSDSGESTVQGRQAAHAETSGSTIRTELGYDALGRLRKASEESATGCTERTYAFDADSNRTSRTTVSDDCDTATDDAVAQTSSYGYDTAHRLTGDTTSYDAFGRTTTDGTTTLSYYANDLVRSETDGAERRTWSLDAASRIAEVRPATRAADGTWTDGVVTTSHYGDESDDPTWTKRSDGTVTRYVSDALGQLSAVSTDGGGTTLQFLNLHGDVAVTLALDTKAATVNHYDEYGKTAGTTAASSAYGWLGGMQRSSDTVSGMTLMGVRLYSSETGRFLSTDPVNGGSCSGYDYACADPVNKSDLSGTMTAGCKTFKKSYKVYEGGVKIQIGTIHMQVRVCVKSSGKISSSRGSATGDESGVASKIGWKLGIGSAYESSGGTFYTNWRADGMGQVCMFRIIPICGYQERYKMTMSYGVKYGPVGGWFKPKWGAKCTNSKCKFRFK